MRCAGCGIEVHIGCHGNDAWVADHSSSESSQADEGDDPAAWFCEPCLAGEVSPHCCLCPGIEGAFKMVRMALTPLHAPRQLCIAEHLGVSFRPALTQQANTRQTNIPGWWVHVVCALYSSFVTWDDASTMSPVIINRIPVEKWGAKVGLLAGDHGTSSAASIVPHRSELH